MSEKNSKKITEEMVEKRLVEGVKKLKGLIYKFNSQGNNGVPDRICVFPGGYTAFVELKRPGGVLSKIQEYQIESLRNLRHRVTVISSLEDVDRFLLMYDFVGDYV